MTKIARGTFALALALAGTLSLSACSSDEDDVRDFAPDKSASQPATPAEPVQPVETAIADVTSPEAKAELEEACDKVTDDEAALMLGVDTKATGWTVEKSMGEATDFNMETAEYESTGKPQCVWVVTTTDLFDNTDRTLWITLRGPASASTSDGATVQFPNGDVGSYGGDDDATLYVIPSGSDFEYTYAADFPQEGSPYQVQQGLRIATAQAAQETLS